ncbi:MAG TPA: SDR family oxidoreductase [Microbacteriaceae bacterium]|nr:SDR family oxidoreductase [Microbacteriaceae bacterium]
MTDIDWTEAIRDPLAETSHPRLDGRVAIVAGGGLSGPLGGVGFALAWLLARGGASVAVLDRDEAAAARTVDLITDAGGTAVAYALDMTDGDAVGRTVDAAAQRFGRLDLVADSIGGGGVMGIFEASEDDWDTAFDLNLTQVWHLIRHSQRHLTAGGAIVTISSSAAEGRGPGLPYSVAKTALEKLTVGAAGTLAPRGIRANAVRVGMIWGAFAAKDMSEELREVRRKNVAMQTEGNSWDIASAAHFLLTDQARWITGQVLTVDGGGFAATNRGSAGSAATKPA